MLSEAYQERLAICHHLEHMATIYEANAGLDDYMKARVLRKAAKAVLAGKHLRENRAYFGIELSQARHCIDEMKRNGTFQGHRIGCLTQPCHGEASSMFKGEIVLFRPDESGTLTIEYAMAPNAIEEQRKKGSLLTTMGTMVSVPAHYVKEIK